MRPVSSASAALAACLILTGCQTVSSNPIGAAADARSSGRGELKPVAATEAPMTAGEKLEEPTDEQIAALLSSLGRPRGQAFDKNAARPSDQAGIAYFLPRQLVKVSVGRKSVVLANAIKKYAEAQVALKEAEGAVESLEERIESINSALIDNKDSKLATDILVARLAETNTALSEARKVVVKKTTGLDEATVALEKARRNQESLVQGNNLRYAAEAAVDERKRLEALLADAKTAELAAKVAHAAAKSASDAKPQDATLRLAMEKARKTWDAAIESVAGTADQLNLARHNEHALAENLMQAITAGRNVDGVDSRVEAAFTVTVEMALQAPTADPRAGYRMNPNHSIFRDDNHNLTLSSEGLVTSADTVAVDRTGEVVVELATFAGAMFAPGPKGLAGFGESSSYFKAMDQEKRPVTRKPRDCRFTPMSVTGLVDLTDSGQVYRLNEQIACLGARINVREDEPIRGIAPGAQRSERVPVDGIAYRTPVSVHVDILRCEQRIADCVASDPEGNPLWATGQTVALSLPQAGPTSYVRQNSGFGTRSRYGLTFKDGILQGYQSERPSEALQVASLPMKVVDGVFTGISKIISLRTGVNEKTKAYIGSQTGIEQAKTELAAAALTGDKKLFDEKLNLLKAQVALQQGSIDGDRQLVDANLNLLNSRILLEKGATTGQTGLATADLELLKKLAELETARSFSPVNSANTQLEVLVAQLRNQARLEAINKCVADATASGASYETCLTK